LGDGAPGATGDELATAQNLSLVKGKLLRIDVTNGNLAFPAANPHQISGDGIPDEIIGEGLRNVWRFSFDPLNGDMWLGDVG
jgi:glucose/arabinose dehydrogenase